jgi:SpoVK/Ycf46/Vps4 family AAA+-type ATPase
MKLPQFYNMISDSFWKLEKDIVNISNKIDDRDNCRRFTLSSVDYSRVIPCNKADEIISYIKDYSNYGFGRSILFYGQPGTGKSNLAKCVAKEFGRTLVISLEVLNDYPHKIISCLDLNPKVIILEDIDHSKIEENSELLHLLEEINNRKIILIATANEVKPFNPAFLRAGRFDKLIEINKLDEQVVLGLVDQDRDVFERVKDYPIASILEVMKRIKVEGKAATLAALADLEARHNSQRDCTL